MGLTAGGLPLGAWGLFLFGWTLVCLGAWLAYGRPQGDLIRRLRAVTSDDPGFSEVGTGGDSRHAGRTRERRFRDRRRLPRDGHGRSPRDLAAAHLLEQAALPLQVREYAAFRAGAGLIVGLLGLAAAGPVGAGIGAIGGFALPHTLVKRRAQTRVAALETQVADALVLMSSALHAGYSLPQALASTARETPEPLGHLLGEVERRSGLGTPVEDVLAEVAERMGSADLGMVATAVAVERTVGGSLGGILDGMAVTIRERLQVRMRLRAMTSQNRLSASILTVLPLGVGGLLALTARSFVSILWTTMPGLGILGAILVLDTLGALWIRRVSRLDI